MSEKLLLTLKEVSQILGISTRTVWEWTARGDIPAVKIGRLVRYAPEDLKQWVEEKRRRAVQTSEGME